ncbi:MAG: DUF4340 domain-containing protein [Chthoniobacteraceae bacterium]
MKGKQLALLLVLVVVVGGASWYLQKGNRSTWSETGTGAGGKVVNLALNDVARVTIKAPDGELNLVKKDDTWTVQERADYPAAFEKVSDLLRKVWDLKTVQEVKVGASQLPRLELIEPGKGDNAGTLVDFKDKDGKRLEALLLGKKFLKKGDTSMGDMPGFPAGRYLMPLGDKAKVSLVSESFEDTTPKPETWLKKDFIKIEAPKSISLAGTTEPQHWKLTRESGAGDWKLADAKPDEQLDNAKASPLNSLFVSAGFVDVLAPDAKPADTGLDKPAVATFETTDNFTYTLKIGKLTGDSYPVTVEVSANLAKERTPGKDEKPEDKTKLDADFQANLKRLEEKLAGEKKFEGRPYLIAKFTIDSLLKDRAALLAEKKPETPPAPATGSATPPIQMSPLPGAQAVTPPVSVPPAATPPPPPPKPAPVATPSPAPPATPTPPTPSATPAPPAPSATPAPPAPPATPAPPAPTTDKTQPPN